MKYEIKQLKSAPVQESIEQDLHCLNYEFRSFNQAEQSEPFAAPAQIVNKSMSAAFKENAFATPFDHNEDIVSFKNCVKCIKNEIKPLKEHLIADNVITSCCWRECH